MILLVTVPLWCECCSGTTGYGKTLTVPKCAGHTNTANNNKNQNTVHWTNITLDTGAGGEGRTRGTRTEITTRTPSNESSWWVWWVGGYFLRSWIPSRSSATLTHESTDIQMFKHGRYRLKFRVSAISCWIVYWTTCRECAGNWHCNHFQRSSTTPSFCGCWA